MEVGKHEIVGSNRQHLLNAGREWATDNGVRQHMTCITIKNSKSKAGRFVAIITYNQPFVLG